MITDRLNRRAALGLIGAGAAVSALAPPSLATAVVRSADGSWRTTAPGNSPWLATPAQIAAERMLLELLKDPEIACIQTAVRAELAVSPRARNLPDAMPTLDGAIAQWTNSLIFAEIIKDTTRPAFVWGTDDTPRDWLGHHLGGVGTSGDNPDAVYRTAGIAGGGRYEILGQYHADSRAQNRPAQVLIEVNAGDMAQPQNVMPTAGGKHQDIHNAAQINQDQFVVDAQGAFRITLGGDPTSADFATWAGPNHIPIPEGGYCLIGVRDILSNWTQRASGLTLRRVDPVKLQPWGIEQVRKLVHRDLAGYIRFWSHFPDIWFGGLAANTHSPPQQRPGGWGYVAGLNYHLAADEALVVTTDPAGSKYTGFQINDPWMIAPDARARQVCLNGSQVTPNADGTVTYVIAVSDPGAANWLDTTGYHDGLAIIRWQAIPPGLKGDGLIREFRVAKLSEVAGMKDLPRVTPAERRTRVAARKGDYETRVR